MQWNSIDIFCHVVVVFEIFASLAEFERELIREQKIAGLAQLKHAKSQANIRLALAVMQNKVTLKTNNAKSLDLSRATRWSYENTGKTMIFLLKANEDTTKL
jgi:DNA invertase Pin-like site-specific DNA recombinase